MPRQRWCTGDGRRHVCSRRRSLAPQIGSTISFLCSRQVETGVGRWQLVNAPAMEPYLSCVPVGLVWSRRDARGIGGLSLPQMRAGVSDVGRSPTKIGSVLNLQQKDGPW
jgi:hypothetical protein